MGRNWGTGRRGGGRRLGPIRGIVQDRKWGGYGRIKQGDSAMGLAGSGEQSGWF